MVKTRSGKVSSSRDADTNVLIAAQQSTKCTEFTCFVKLPIEIRLKIWEEACFVPRIIDVGLSQICGNSWNEDLLPEELSCCWASHSIIPPSILHVSKEARQIGFQFYNLEFGTSTKYQTASAKFSFSRPAMVYVNWACDILCFVNYTSRLYGDSNFPLLRHMADFEQLKRKARHIAVDFTNWQENGFTRPIGERVEELTLYLMRDREYSSSTDYLFRGGFDLAAPFSFELIRLEHEMEKKMKAAGYTSEDRLTLLEQDELFRDKNPSWTGNYLQAKEPNPQKAIKFALLDIQDI